jgi:hypothetical protein
MTIAPLPPLHSIKKTHIPTQAIAPPFVLKWTGPPMLYSLPIQRQD